MHNNYYFLRRVASELDVRLKNFTLVSCFSQNRDELIVEFFMEPVHFFVRASLLSEFSTVSFPVTVKRARKNSIDLFPELIMRKVTGSQSFENDRSFLINLEGGHGLLFKMHGNRSNVLHLKDKHVTDIFRKGIESDFKLDPTELPKKIDWLSRPTTPEALFTFPREVWNYLGEHGYEEKSPGERWEMILDARRKLETAPEFFQVEEGSGLTFSLLPYGNIVSKVGDPFVAVTAFVAGYSSAQAFLREKSSLVRRLKQQTQRLEAYLSKTRQHLSRLSADHHFQQWGDLLMAHLGTIALGQKAVTLNNFYEGDKPVEIRLNPRLSAQKNAEVYYRKARNRSIEVGRNQELLIKKEMELLHFGHLVAKAESAQSLAEVRALTATQGDDKRDGPERLPYREIEFGGFRIWVGKDAQRNDELTTRFGYKEDLWLHAKDTAGSHVLVKHQAGKVFPKPVIERAAQLAAFFSKRKTDTLCPVAYTPKKYVRKRKGDPVGMVVVEREKVLLVEPKGV